MDYAAHYERLIERARNRTLSGYRERHHVIPKCLGGSNAKENIVELTPEEHFVAHQILVKLHPHHSGIIWASVYMAKRCTGNKAFGWLRRKHAQAMLGTKRGLGNASNTGRKLGPLSEERKAFLRGNKFALGLKHTPETLARISAAGRGRKVSAETRTKIGDGHRGKTISVEARLKIAIANTGKKRSPQQRATMSAARIGNKNALGSKHSPESRAKMSASRIGRKPSSETLEKMSAAQKGKVISPEHRAKIAATLTGRPVVRTPEGTARIAAAARKRMLSDANPGRGRGRREAQV